MIISYPRVRSLKNKPTIDINRMIRIKTKITMVKYMIKFTLIKIRKMIRIVMSTKIKIQIRLYCLVNLRKKKKTIKFGSRKRTMYFFKK